MNVFAVCPSGSWRQSVAFSTSSYVSWATGEGVETESQDPTCAEWGGRKSVVLEKLRMEQENLGCPVQTGKMAGCAPTAVRCVRESSLCV